MSQAHKIVLVGFSSFEKVTFESFFRLAARRPPGYVLVDDASQAHLAVVNADDAAVLRQCIAAKPAAQVLLVGSQDGGTGWTLQRRPLNLMKVLATVESLLSPPQATMPAELSALGEPRSRASAPAVPQPRQVAAASPTVSSQSTERPRGTFASAAAAIAASVTSGMTRQSVTTAPAPMLPAAPAFSVGMPQSPSPQRPVAAPTSPANMSAQASLPSRASAQTGMPPSGAPDSIMRRSVRSGAGTPQFESSRADSLGDLLNVKSDLPASAMDIDHILVVDDSDIALKFMRNRLSRFGFNADLVNSGEEALGKMNTRPYKFVFLDVMMEGLDGYQTCRAMKQRKYSDGKPPVVVMLTSRGGTIDKIRGTLAGCDAYLTKPLNERDLIAVLAKHDRNVARSFQETNFGSNAGSGFARSLS